MWRFASGNYAPNKIEVIDLRPQKERRIRWKYNPDGSKSPVEIGDCRVEKTKFI